MRASFRILFLIVALFSLFASLPLSAKNRNDKDWKLLHPGLSYSRYEETDGHYILHAFQVDLKKLSLSPIVSNEATTVKEMLKKNKALLTINASFFDPLKKPLGLIIKNKKNLNPLRSVSWWGVFTIENAIAKIIAKKDFKPSPTIETAIQTGPRLIENGELISGLKENVSAKSALCTVATPSQAFIFASEGVLSTSALAGILKDHFHCNAALNLDGGSSTQLYTKIKNFELDLSGFSLVPVGLGVFTH